VWNDIRWCERRSRGPCHLGNRGRWVDRQRVVSRSNGWVERLGVEILEMHGVDLTKVRHFPCGSTEVCGYGRAWANADQVCTLSLSNDCRECGVQQYGYVLKAVVCIDAGR